MIRLPSICSHDYEDRFVIPNKQTIFLFNEPLFLEIKMHCGNLKEMILLMPFVSAQFFFLGLFNVTKLNSFKKEYFHFILFFFPLEFLYHEFISSNAYKVKKKVQSLLFLPIFLVYLTMWFSPPESTRKADTVVGQQKKGKTSCPAV